MKALDKDRTRRYGAASDLAADLRRHLDHLPVLAGPPSQIIASRSLSAAIRRASRSLGLVVLLAFLAGAMTVQAKRIARERDLKKPSQRKRRPPRKYQISWWAYSRSLIQVRRAAPR